MTAEMTDGSIRQSHLSADDEDLMRGPSDQELEAKFKRLTWSAMKRDRQETLLDFLWRLDEVPDVADVVSRITTA